MRFKDMQVDENTDFTLSKVFKWAVIMAAIVTLLGLIGSAFSLFSTVATAPGKVITKTLQADNIIQSYEWFYDVDAAYKARHGQVVQYKNMFQTETDKDEKYRIRTELAAMQQTCRDLATKYNANSEKMNKSIFKGWSLPETLSQTACN
jgi:hypothetical protein